MYICNVCFNDMAGETTKYSVKKLYEKITGIGEYDEQPDIHGNHRRSLKPGKERKVRRLLQRDTEKVIKESNEDE